jgi:hypothetical protein
VKVQEILNVLLVKMINISTMLLVSNHVQKVPITNMNLRFAKTVMLDVPSVPTKPILIVLNVIQVTILMILPVSHVTNVQLKEICTVMMKLMNADHVITNVLDVKIELINVSNVLLLESMLHPVPVQMVSSITEIPVSDVTTDVPPVSIETPV